MDYKKDLFIVHIGPKILYVTDEVDALACFTFEYYENNKERANVSTLEKFGERCYQLGKEEKNE